MHIPESPWESIFLNCITDLSKSKGYNSIVVVVCYLSKMARFIPTQAVGDAVKVAQLFMENIFNLHRLPKIIISYRDPTNRTPEQDSRDYAQAERRGSSEYLDQIPPHS